MTDVIVKESQKHGKGVFAARNFTEGEIVLPWVAERVIDESELSTLSEKSIEFVRAVAEDDLVALHTRQQWPSGDEYITMDFFRFDDNGKIIEHWDSIQKIPAESANNNMMY